MDIKERKIVDGRRKYRRIGKIEEVIYTEQSTQTSKLHSSSIVIPMVILYQLHSLVSSRFFLTSNKYVVASEGFTRVELKKNQSTQQTGNERSEMRWGGWKRDINMWKRCRSSNFGTWSLVAYSHFSLRFVPNTCSLCLSMYLLVRTRPLDAMLQPLFVSHIWLRVKVHHFFGIPSVMQHASADPYIYGLSVFLKMVEWWRYSLNYRFPNLEMAQTTSVCYRWVDNVQKKSATPTDEPARLT